MCHMQYSRLKEAKSGEVNVSIFFKRRALVAGYQKRVVSCYFKVIYATLKAHKMLDFGPE